MDIHEKEMKKKNPSYNSIALKFVNETFQDDLNGLKSLSTYVATKSHCVAEIKTSSVDRRKFQMHFRIINIIT